jgi:hypothetical protein
MMKNIYILICFLLTSSILTGQSHEFSIYGAGGMSNLGYKFDGGKGSGGTGFGAGVGYTYNISDNFGITTGAGFASYSGKATSETLSGQYVPDNADGNFSYSIAGYEEKQSATMVVIPLMLQYNTDGSTSFVAAGGLKFGLPVSAKTTITSGVLTTSGHYSYEDQTYSNLPQHSFVTGQSIADIKSDTKFGLATMLSLEAGLRFSLSEKTGLYAGLFLDYGLNSIQKSGDKHVVEYQASNPQFKYNSVLNTGMVDKVNLFSIGLKVAIKIRNN